MLPGDPARSPSSVVISLQRYSSRWRPPSRGPGRAAETNVAVAANFTEPAKEIAHAFEGKTGHKAILSFGATGQFYAQITQGAPFEVFLSADESRPKKARRTRASRVAGSRSPTRSASSSCGAGSPAWCKGEQTLRDGKFAKIAIANPTAAPYGAAGDRGR